MDGVLTALRVTFDDASRDETTVAGNVQHTPFPYAGKTITITRGASGTIHDDFSGDAPPQAVADLHGLLDAELVFLPTHPVAVGEEWSADPSVLARMLQLSGDDRAGMTLQLLGVKSQNNCDVAEVKVSSVALRRQNQMQMHLTMQGTSLIDLKTGHPIRSDITGKIDNKGEQPGPGANGEQVNYHVEGAGTMSSAAVSSLLEMAKAPAGSALVAPSSGIRGWRKSAGKSCKSIGRDRSVRRKILRWQTHGRRLGPRGPIYREHQPWRTEIPRDRCNRRPLSDGQLHHIGGQLSLYRHARWGCDDADHRRQDLFAQTSCFCFARESIRCIRCSAIVIAITRVCCCGQYRGWQDADGAQRRRKRD